jgi:hypothetical protein
VREAFDGSAPQDVRTLRHAPLERQVLPIGETASIGTAELGPVLSFELGRENEKERETNQRDLLYSLLG